MTFTGLLVGVIAGQLASRRLPGLRRGVGGQRRHRRSPRWGRCSSPSPSSSTSCTCPAGWPPGWPCSCSSPRASPSPGASPGRATRSAASPCGGCASTPSTSSASPSSSSSASSPSLLAGHLRVEPLVRRGDLVSQLHFAVTMQDLRTVVLLRRQLRGEQPRTRPWFGLRPTLTGSPARADLAARLARPAALPGRPPDPDGRPGDRRRHRRRSPCCAARRRPSSASASPSTCSASTPSSRCRRRSTTPTTPTACRSRGAG